MMGFGKKQKVKKNQIVVATSGYFDPVHSGHIRSFKKAKELGDKLVVILNNDAQSKLKKGHAFMPLKERKYILESIRYVDEVFVSIDRTRGVSRSLEKIKPNIFAKGGDRNIKNIPEREICEKLGIKIVDRLGRAFLKQSSSKILKKYVKKKLQGTACKECRRKIQ